jgi:peptidoglycan/LPS O-acetylase OafA/YrhL
MPAGHGEDRSIGATRSLRGYRPDVQVLRGVAVLAVVLYHAGLLTGGFVGVDVFFVISGFVIGRVLLAEYVDRGSISLGRFYARRIRRLLPALALMLTTVVLLAPFLSPYRSVRETVQTAVATMLLGANAILYRHVGYFDPAARLNPLLHTWSLSVEEQFYLAIPTLLVVALLFRGAKLSSVTRVALMIGTVAAISFGLSVGLSSGLQLGALHLHPRFAFYAPVTRAWEFLVGFALVLVPERVSPAGIWRLVLAGIGVAGLAYSVVALSDQMAFPGWIALLPVFSTAMLIATRSLEAGSRVHRVRWALLKPIERLGDLSYSWYLWHWPVMVFAKAYWVDASWVPWVAGAASLVPAWASYRYVENPIRKRTAGRRAAPFGIAAACLLATMTAGMFVLRGGGQTPRIHAHQYAYALHIAYLRGCDSTVPLGERNARPCTWGSPASPEHVVLVGDSNAGQFSEALIGASNKLGDSITIATLSSCPFVVLPAAAPDACRHFVEGTVSYLVSHPPAVVVIGMAGSYLKSMDEESVLRGLTDVTTRLQRAGARVALLAVVPMPEDVGSSWTPDACSVLAWADHWHACALAPFPKQAGWRVPMNQIIEAVAARTGADVWRYGDLACPGAECTPMRKGVPVWRNEGHISVPFGRLLIDRTVQYLGAVEQAGRPATTSARPAMPR